MFKNLTRVYSLVILHKFTNELYIDGTFTDLADAEEHLNIIASEFSGTMYKISETEKLIVTKNGPQISVSIQSSLLDAILQ